MPINVTCPGCKKRFTVSEKFAGLEGPCPKCKTVIQIPKLEDQVVVHAPDDGVPKDSRGRSIVKPILREETKFSTQAAVIIAFSVVVVFVIAAVLGRSYPDGSVPIWLQGLAAVLLGPPVALAGYTFLRNDELEPYRGTDLWLRVAACGAAYAFLWGAYAWVQWVLEIDFTVYQLMYVLPPIVLAGAFVAFASLDLDYSTGLIHYAFYLIVTIVLRLVAGMQAF